MNRPRPLFSVVIPTYNRSKGIVQTIKSVVTQTLRDLEILVVDDGSTDDTVEYAKSIDDSRVRFIVLNQNSGGPAYPMNVGVKNSMAPFVAFLDHDDVAFPWWLESLHRSVQSGRKTGMAWGSMRLVDENGTVIAIAIRCPSQIRRTGRILPKMLTWSPGISSLIVRKEIFDYLEGFDEKITSMADLDFTMKFAIESRWSVSISDEVVVDHLVHSGNLSSKVDKTLLCDVERIIEKNDETWRRFPKAKSEFLYREARLRFLLDDTVKGNRVIRECVRTYPFHLRAIVFLALTTVGMKKLWNWAEKVRYRRFARKSLLNAPGVELKGFLNDSH